jgi:hypothetical protein
VLVMVLAFSSVSKVTFPTSSCPLTCHLGPVLALPQSAWESCHIHP